MDLYSEADTKTLNDKIDEIIKNADAMRLQKVEPIKDKMWQMIFIVRDFVIEKKRKIYGGFALNKLIEDVAPEDKFYDDDNVEAWDIDFYSPDPLNDAREIANRLKAKGFKHVQAREAQHDETYAVFAETNACADITYVPRYIYNKIPFKEVNKLTLTGPHFMMIDYFRVLTDPLTSYFRLGKTFDRLFLMLKHYPLPHITSSIEIVPPDRDLDVAFHAIHNFVTDRETTVLVGMYAYNHLIRESGIRERTKQLKRSKQNKQKQHKQKQHKQNREEKTNTNTNTNSSSSETKIDFVDVNYYEIVSTDYKRDARELILQLYDKFPNAKDRITYQEYFPFFGYLGFSVHIYFDGIIICRMYHYNTRCIPYFDVPALYFTQHSYEESTGTIRIGSFALQMLYNLINILKARTNNDHNTKNVYYTMISHMAEMKNYFFAKTHKTIYDESLFQEFVINCTGRMLTPIMEKQLRIEKKKRAGKKLSWSYNPDDNRDVNRKEVMEFKNTSGNAIDPIKSKRHLKIDLSDNANDDTGSIDNESYDVSDDTDADAADSNNEGN